MSHLQILPFVHNLIKYMAAPLEQTKHGHKLPESYFKKQNFWAS